MIFNDNLTRKFYHQKDRIVFFLDAVMTFIETYGYFPNENDKWNHFFCHNFAKNHVIRSVSRSHSNGCSRHFSTCSDLSILHSKFSDPICSYFISDNLFCLPNFIQSLKSSLQYVKRA